MCLTVALKCSLTLLFRFIQTFVVVFEMNGFMVSYEETTCVSYT